LILDQSLGVTRRRVAQWAAWATFSLPPSAWTMSDTGILVAMIHPPCWFYIQASGPKAMTSTSTKAPLGISRTATQERAGLPVKYRPYTSLKAAKLPMSDRKQVVLTTSA